MSRCGGVFFNWTSLLIMMQREGFYHDLCPAGTAINDICDEQSKKFNSIYNNAFYSSAVANGVFGLAVDAIGAKLTGGISTALVTLGSLLMTFTPGSVSLVSPAVVLLALGGPGINFAAITLSNLFRNSQLIVTCFSGFFTLATYSFSVPPHFSFFLSSMFHGQFAHDPILCYFYFIFYLYLKNEKYLLIYSNSPKKMLPFPSLQHRVPCLRSNSQSRSCISNNLLRLYVHLHFIFVLHDHKYLPL